MPKKHLIPAVILSYVVGLAAYLLALHIGWNQSISSGDLSAVLFTGILGYTLLGIPCYFALLHATYSLFKRFCGPRSLPLWAAMLVPTPGAFIIIAGIFWLASYGHVPTSAAFFTPEALLFFAFFFTSGSVFGLCWWLSRSKRL